AGFATQVVLNARLTRFYEREDWKKRLKVASDIQPLLLERGLSLDIRPVEPQVVAPPVLTPEPILDQAASLIMAKIAADAEKKSGGKAKLDVLEAMRTRHASLLAKKELSE